MTDDAGLQQLRRLAAPTPAASRPPGPWEATATLLENLTARLAVLENVARAGRIRLGAARPATDLDVAQAKVRRLDLGGGIVVDVLVVDADA